MSEFGKVTGYKVNVKKKRTAFYMPVTNKWKIKFQQYLKITRNTPNYSKVTKMEASTH